MSSYSSGYLGVSRIDTSGNVVWRRELPLGGRDWGYDAVMKLGRDGICYLAATGTDIFGSSTALFSITQAGTVSSTFDPPFGESTRDFVVGIDTSASGQTTLLTQRGISKGDFHIRKFAPNLAKVQDFLFDPSGTHQSRPRSLSVASDNSVHAGGTVTLDGQSRGILYGFNADGTSRYSKIYAEKTQFGASHTSGNRLAAIFSDADGSVAIRNYDLFGGDIRAASRPNTSPLQVFIDSSGRTSVTTLNPNGREYLDRYSTSFAKEPSVEVYSALSFLPSGAFGMIGDGGIVSADENLAIGNFYEVFQNLRWAFGFDYLGSLMYGSYDAYNDEYGTEFLGAIIAICHPQYGLIQVADPHRAPLSELVGVAVIDRLGNTFAINHEFGPEHEVPVLVKLRPDGTQLWKQPLTDVDWARSPQLALSDDGSVVVGSTVFGKGPTRVEVKQIESSGLVRWVRVFNTIDRPTLSQLKVSGSDALLTMSVGNLTRVAKISAAGNVTYNKNFVIGNAPTTPLSLAVSPSGKVMFTAETRVGTYACLLNVVGGLVRTIPLGTANAFPVSLPSDLWAVAGDKGAGVQLTKVAANGGVLATTTYVDVGTQKCKAIAASPAGDIYFAGNRDGNPLIARFNSALVRMWTKVVSSTHPAGFKSLVFGPDDAAYAYGERAGTLNYGAVLLKYAPSGTVLSISNMPSGYSTGYGIAGSLFVGQNLDVVTTSTAPYPDEAKDALTTRFIQPVAPVATNDLYMAVKNAPLNVPGPGVLANDKDANLETLTAVLVAAPPPTRGSLILGANGAFQFIPATGFVGPVTFTYRAKDSSGLVSNVATVNITVK
jgi:hypothetical protein